MRATARYALKLYERRQKPRVELARAKSRWLAKVTFVNNPALVRLRDQLVRFYTMKINDISRKVIRAD